MLNYREAFKQLGDEKNGFYSPRATLAKGYLDYQFSQDPLAFRNQVNDERKLENKVKKRETPIGEYPKFKPKKAEQIPTIYPGD